MPARAAPEREEADAPMKDGTTVWLPYDPSRIPGLPDGLSYAHWDGSGPLPGDPGEVRFLVGPPAPGAERVLRPVLPRMRKLEVLQLLSSGYDHMLPLLDLLPAGSRLATGRGVHREATAEHAVTLLLALCRGLDRFATHQAAGEWRPELHTTLVGKRVLVIGYGAVGAAVTARLAAFRCEAVLVARTARTTPAGRVHGAEELRALLPTADAVVVCAPLTDQTRGMFGADMLELLKDGALLVNVARGELIDTRALIARVRAGQLRVALDVTDPEPLPNDHPLWHLPGAAFPGPVGRPAPGGFALSGSWRLPSHDGTGSWLALPLAAATGTDPDLFVVSSKVLPGAIRALPAVGDGQGPVFRLENAYVPAGFVTRTTGGPLRAGDAAFLWTAVTALALGAARRMTEVLADPASGIGPRGPVTPAAAAGELAAVLHDERLSLTAALHGAPSVRQGVAPSVEERLAAYVERVGDIVGQVVVATYEWTLTPDRGAGGHPLVRVIEESSPILQQVRYARELLPCDDRTSRRKD
jgi:phosphoglycerate dehydrogenase-like enzyme